MKTQNYLKIWVKQKDLYCKKCQLTFKKIWVEMIMKHLTYLQSIRKFCIECMGGSPQLVENCPSSKCKLYPFRLGKKPNTKAMNTPLKSIRLYCLECVGTSDEVKNGSMPKCPIYYYRFGRNPKLQGRGNPIALKKFRENATKTPILVSNFKENSK